MTPIALAAAAAFNLVCVGTQDGSRFGRLVQEKKPIREVFSVDLEARRFCFEGCEQTLPIASVSDTEIVLQRQTLPNENASFERTVNRESGEMYSRVDVSGVVLTSYSKCRLAAFTGFPQRKF